MVATVEGGAGAGSHGLNLKLGAKNETKEKQEIERSFKVHREKLQELDRWLPELKKNIRTFFSLSDSTKAVFLQIDDLYHLKSYGQILVTSEVRRQRLELAI